MFLTLNECCGYTAAVVSCLAFGSFAVPIKCKAARQVEVDPLVLQTYKVAAAFLTCWLVLLIDGVQFSFSPWGLVSGLFMVPGGTAGYYAVQNAGLATSQGIWCSLKVIVAFAWGLFVFHEQVRSTIGTMISITMLVIGLVGMSYFSSPKTDEQTNLLSSQAQVLPNEEGDNESSLRVPLVTDNDIESAPMDSHSSSLNDRKHQSSGEVDEESSEPLAEDSSTSSMDVADAKWQSRRLGILGAIIDGAYGGSVLVPMHYAKSANTQGLQFLISFSIGCSIVCVLFWILRWGLCATRAGSVAAGWRNLPSLHVRSIGAYAAVAGLIWSLGNVSSIVTVAFLGQGVGYSIVQSQLLVAGLWGVFWFKEIRDRGRICRWFTSAVITISGILLISKQHIPLPAHGLHSATR